MRINCILVSLIFATTSLALPFLSACRTANPCVGLGDMASVNMQNLTITAHNVNLPLTHSTGAIPLVFVPGHQPSVTSLAVNGLLQTGHNL